MMTVLFILFASYIFLFLAGAWGWMHTRNVSLKKYEIIKKHSISVIIPARNEEKNIGALLDSILANDYDRDAYEINIIDDHSEDATATIVQGYAAKYSFVKLIPLADYISDRSSINSFKKTAIAIAIRHAKGDIILQTDADCIVPRGWLAAINKAFADEQICIVAAPVDLLPIPGGLGNKILYWFQSLDFLTMQGITAATHFYHIGAMANGANIAYRKAVYQSISGFDGIDAQATGDDMMLMQKVLTHYPVSSIFLKDKSAIVRTQPPDTVQAFLQQRIRWSAKAAHYKDKRLTAILTVVYLFNLGLLLLSLMCMFTGAYWTELWIIGTVKVGVELFLVIPLCKFFDKSVQVLVFPLLQPLHIVYIIISGFFGTNGTYRWKGRVVK